MKLRWPKWVPWSDKATAPVEDVLEDLRGKLRDLGVDLSAIHVQIEDKPTRRHRQIRAADGSRIGRDWAGAYVQIELPAYEDDFAVDDTLPGPVIFLFRENIVPPTRENTERVILHEIGHAFGLNEYEVHNLGLGVG